MQWGDGHGDKRPHVIVGISYERDFIDCSCGDHLTGIADGSAWKAHGGKLLDDIEVTARTGPEYSETVRARKAFDIIAERALNCTCDITGVEGCPNYQDGDEND